jgi:hypothetical protein
MRTVTAPVTTDLPKAGISAKVSNANLGGAALAVLTACLTLFVPAWRQGIPDVAEPFIVAGAYGLAAFGTGWWSTHRASAAEILTALEQAKALLAAEGAAVAEAGAIAPALAAAARPAKRKATAADLGPTPPESPPPPASFPG